MNELLELLRLQKEVKYLLWCIQIDHKTQKICVILSTIGMEKKVWGKTPDDCIGKVIDLLFELKSKEAWALKKAK